MKNSDTQRRLSKASFLRHHTGAVMIEFGLLLPILLFLFFGAIEVSRYVLILQKVDKVAYTLADIITRTPPATTTPPASGSLTAAELNTILNNYSDLIFPYSVGDRGIVAVTSVHKPNASQPPIVKWQATGGGTLRLTGTSSPESLKSDVNNLLLGNITPAVRNTPTNFTPELQTILDTSGGMRPDENMIVVEVFYVYTPLFFGNALGFGEVLFHRRAFFVPRGTDNFLNLPPTFS